MIFNWNYWRTGLKPLQFTGFKLSLQAKNLLNNGKNTDALHAFRKAYNQNPEYYYLGNYIQHLEFVQSAEYESLKSEFEEYLGDYDNLKLYKEGARYYQMDNRGRIYQLLPMAEDKFMNPSKYNTQIHMIREGERVIGLKEVLNDGNETIYHRIAK